MEFLHHERKSKGVLVCFLHLFHQLLLRRSLSVVGPELAGRPDLLKDLALLVHGLVEVVHLVPGGLEALL